MYFQVYLSTSRTLPLRRNIFKPVHLQNSFKTKSTLVSCCRNWHVTIIFYSLRKHSQKINSHAYITKTYYKSKPLPIGTYVLKRDLSHVHFSDKLKPLRIGAYKILIIWRILSDVTYELLPQDDSTVHVHRNNLNTYYPT